MSTVSRRHFFGQGAAGAAAIALGARVVGAQDWAKAILDKSPRRKEWVTVKNGARTVDSFVAHPQSTAKAPGIVVIHEIFGMTDWVQNVTDEFAAAGWVAIAPDLLSGMTPDGKPARNLPMSAAGGMITKLPPDQITADLNACVDYVKGLPSCNGKVSVVGFSWGGSQCFRFATNRKDLAAAFVFYGSGPDAADMPRIQAPVYGFYGGNDARIGASVPPTQEQMKAANKVFEPVTYEGAGHGFMRGGEDPSGSEADKKAREAAWVRLKSLVGNYK
ncbi:MAG TPA: dienelactone hydrolase family protein [Vicinamibacterales bacterium]|jgi:carboxymethylenebutenolidase